MTEPLVSVLIPVYNAGRFLLPALQSILTQSYTNLEIIIIDDGSTDGCLRSIDKIADERVRIIKKRQNKGRASALNEGLRTLSGIFYATQDADDTSYPRRIELQVKAMHQNPEIAAVFTGYDIILDNRPMAPRFTSKDTLQCRKDIEDMRMPSHDPTAMYRVSKVKEILYEPSLKIAAGFDYILRTAEQHSVMVLGECLYSYRVNFKSTTRSQSLLRKQMVQKVLRRACERRGLNPAEYVPETVSDDKKSIYRDAETGLVPHFMESVLDLRRAGRYRQAVKTAWLCLQLHPKEAYYYKPAAYCIAPITVIEFYRRQKNKRAKIKTGKTHRTNESSKRPAVEIPGH